MQVRKQSILRMENHSPSISFEGLYKHFWVNILFLKSSSVILMALRPIIAQFHCSNISRTYFCG